jgi:antitoxin MazE
LTYEVEIHAAPGILTITLIVSPRAGWAEAAAAFVSDGLLDEPSASRFEDEE